MNRIALVGLSLGLALAACRGADDAPPGDDTTIDMPPIGGVVTIQEVQNDAMAPGTQVELQGVVVTAIDTFGNRTGDFWVEEVGGGPFSGVKVFGAPLDQLAALTVGDIVDIAGAQKDEFAYMAMAGDPTVTELKPVTGGTMTVTKTGTGTVPTPDVVDAAAILAMPTKAARDAEWEKWEGVLIKVTKARQLSAVSTFGSNPGPDSNEFRATAFVRVQSALADLPTTGNVGTCYESITGVGDFFFNWILAPRATADLVSGGTGCIPIATTVVQVQTGTNTEIVNLTNVIVTGRDDIAGTGMTASYGYWIADAPAAAINAGVFVFTKDTVVPPAYVIGAKLATLSGSVTEFDLGSTGMPAMGDTITELTSTTAGAVTAPQGPPVSPATTATVTTLGDIGTAGEPWEGVLVKIGPVKVTNASAGGGKIEVTDNNGAKIFIDDDAFVITAPAANACIQVTGLMSVAIFDDKRTINPRSNADVASDNGCN